MHRAIVVITALLFAAAAGRAQSTGKPPRGRELDKLVERILAADDTDDAAHREREAMLAEVRSVAPLAPRDVDKWKQKIAKLWRKGRTLEKSGDNLFFADGRGRYIVGGETRKPTGLLIAMHGGGQGSGDAGPAAAAYGPAASRFGWVMIAPEVLERTECGWTDAGTEEFVLGLVDAALRTWKVDADQVYFAGHSMGGYGSWTLGGHHADRVAAIAPSAGAPTPIRERSGGPVRERTGGPIVDIIEGVIPSLRNVFVSVYQSIDDPQVPPGPNQFATKALAQAHERWGGFAHDYWEVDGRGHGAPPGGHVAQLEKIAARTRTAIPEQLVWQPVLTWKRQFHWLWWETPPAGAIVEADLDRERNSVSIRCDKATDGLFVLLDDRVLDLQREVVVTVNGKETFRGTVTASLEMLLRTSHHPDSRLQFTARAPAH